MVAVTPGMQLTGKCTCGRVLRVARTSSWSFSQQYITGSGRRAAPCASCSILPTRSTTVGMRLGPSEVEIVVALLASAVIVRSLEVQASRPPPREMLSGRGASPVTSSRVHSSLPFTTTPTWPWRCSSSGAQWLLPVGESPRRGAFTTANGRPERAIAGMTRLRWGWVGGGSGDGVRGVGCAGGAKPSANNR